MTYLSAAIRDVFLALAMIYNYVRPLVWYIGRSSKGGRRTHSLFQLSDKHLTEREPTLALKKSTQADYLHVKGLAALLHDGGYMDGKTRS